MDRGVTIDLSGRVAIVTGASRGIGRESAILLARAGASVAINHRDSADRALETAAAIGKQQSLIIQADVADPQAVARMIDSTVQRFGRLDILVNNAGVFGFNPFDGAHYDAWQAGWERTFAVNVFGPANAVWQALGHMRRVGGGKVINVASRAAFRGETEFADYGASKAALVNFTRSIARGCAKFNVTANCVAPGFIETEMAASELEAHREELEAQVPLGRIGTAEEVAGVVLFLASPLSDYLNGATIDVNGGSYFH